MPCFGDDHNQEFSISAAQWHEESGHNDATRKHQLLQDKAEFDVHQVETSLATPKTCRVERYLEHVGQSIGNFERLYTHYKQERGMRWKTYRREQKTYHNFSVGIRGGPRRSEKQKEKKREAAWRKSLTKQIEHQDKKKKEEEKKEEDKKEDKKEEKKKEEGNKKPQHRRENVVVAIGSAQFGPTMRGMIGVPLKKLFKILALYVLIVWVDEYRTSRVCSKCSEQRLKGRGSEEEKKKSAEEKRAEEEAIKQR
jgi:hypothetical protein